MIEILDVLAHTIFVMGGILTTVNVISILIGGGSSIDIELDKNIGV